MKDENLFKSKRSSYFMMGVIAIIVFTAMTYSLYSSNRMITRYSPLVDATMEIRYELTTAHLWLEEIISGDRYENIENVMEHLQQVHWYAQAMLEGGQNSEGTFMHLRDTVLRKEVEATVQKIKEFRKLTVKRYNSSASAGIGSEMDQQYDRLFKSILTQIDNVETLLQQKISSNYARYQSIQLALILTIAVLSILGIRLQYRHDRQQRDNLQVIHEAKNRAEKNERWLKTTMNSMGDGVIITDHNGKVVYLNPVASSLTGWLLNDAKNKEMTEIFNIQNEETKKPVDDPVAMVIRKNVIVGLANHTELTSKDGTIWPISDSAAPIFDHDNNLIGVVVVFHEVTAQKKAEAEKAILEAQLHQAFKMEAIGTMAGGIAHDFNNILAIILGNAEMALDSITPENPARYNVDQILQASSRAKDLVKQILSFSRQEKSKKEPAYLCNLVEDSIKSLRSTIPTSVKLIINLPENVADCLTVLADPIQIHQVLLNLCVNAVQAMDEKGVLEITVTDVTIGEEKPASRPGLDSGLYAYLSVCDTGPGMHSDIVKQIFDPFFTTKEVGKGTGMGLSVVHGIIKNHGGKIFVESVQGKGTEFHVYLPVTEKKESITELEEPGPLPAGIEQILLIDDEEPLAAMGKDLIERLGYSVTAMTDSLEALELFKNNPAKFDLVITDQTMPNMTGAELAEQLLQLQPDIPIILCTGYSSKVDNVKAKGAGICEFASKPLKRMDIAKLIRKVLE
jgi:PAS domain S-box-containing protein